MNSSGNSTHTHTYAHTHTHTYTHIHTYTYTHIRTHTRTHTHAYTHTRTKIKYSSSRSLALMQPTLPSIIQYQWYITNTANTTADGKLPAISRLLQVLASPRIRYITASSSRQCWHVQIRSGISRPQDAWRIQIHPSHRGLVEGATFRPPVTAKEGGGRGIIWTARVDLGWVGPGGCV